MATGNDVREIFQLKPSEQVRRVQKTEKKPGTNSCNGISRELYGLIGNNVSTVAFNNPTYKPKLAKGKKAVNWTWRPFMNPSRDDDLTLHHWEKTRTDPNEEYRFYKFNKAISLIDFSEKDYTAHLQDSDWTYDETKYLWDLCRRFDLRWVVIQDRYEWPAQEQDRMALDRYYSINRILTKVRLTDSSQASEKAQLLASMAYDKNREIERKKNLEILNTRTPEQIEEEEALYLEARRIDQNEKKITRERENLLRLLNTRDIYGPGGPASAGLAGQVAGGGGPGTGIIIPSNSITIPSSSSSSDILAAATLPPPKKEKLIPGAYLRSQKTAPIVSTKQQRVQSTLVQLGLPFKPAMPTATVIAKWDQLTNNIVTLLDLKKQVDKLESDVKVVKMRRGSGSSGSSGLIPGSAGAGTAAGAGAGASSAGSTADGNFGVKREGMTDEAGVSGQVKKKKKKE
ncbi:swr complex subunit [Mortierella alpina]|uniref:SWR1-complex protein 4 n=1 Tax=Mortierella alpina TaxID=64518 RepID=A0A9P6LWX1_MORAP|nr:swr complex subunit [Mortierella alpina]